MKQKKFNTGVLFTILCLLTQSSSGQPQSKEILKILDDADIEMNEMIDQSSSNLKIEPDTLNFRTDLRHLPFVLTNKSGNTLNWSIDTNKLPSSVQRIFPSSGSLENGQTYLVNVTVSRQNLSTGTHTHKLTIHTQGNVENVSFKISVPFQKNRHIYVKASATGFDNGSSWDNAFTRIKHAIASVEQLEHNENVEIWVAQGTYYEHEILVPSGVQLYGGFRGDETFLDERQDIRNHLTIVDGQKRGRCFECEHRTVIDGFVIQNGRDWNSGEGKGAAILTYDTNVQIRNNLIRDNVDSWAGALFIEGFNQEKNVDNASPLIERNVFINNFSNYCAAAIEIRGSEAIVRNNTIINNQGYGLEIQAVTGPFQEIIYGNFYNNIITDNMRRKPDDVWGEARKVTNYSFIGKQWTLKGPFEPYNFGVGNIFRDRTGANVGFVDEKNDNYRLCLDSPCINAGDPQSALDSDGTRADLGAFPLNHAQTTLEILPKRIDFDAVSRIKNLTITAYGAQPIEWQIATFSSAGNVLTVTPESGELCNGEKTVVNVNLNRQNLPDGIYEGYIAVMATDQCHELTVTFIENNSKPEIVVEPMSVKLEATMNGENPKSQLLLVDNAVVGDLFWKVKKQFNSDWLFLSPNSGKDGENLSLNIDISKLEFGNYHEDICFTGSNAINKVVVPVDLTIKPGRFIYEIEAENSPMLPNAGWNETVNDGSTCIQALETAIDSPNETTRIDYEFTVPDGIDFIYAFAEVDVNQSRSNDSFWVSVNGFDLCLWDYIHSKYDGWIRCWIYHKKRDNQHRFVVRPGKNTLNIYSREAGGFINWFVITNNPNMNITTYQFGPSIKK